MPEWVNRLRDASFTSPSGIETTFKVDVLNRSGGKKASVHEILNLNQAILQDQGNKVRSYQMEAYFTGNNGDQEADAFYDSLREQYTSESAGLLRHPRWGDIDVMPFEFNQAEQLVTGGGIFRVPVTFYEIPNSEYPTPEGLDPSEITANVEALKELANEANEAIDLEEPSAIAKFAADIKEVVTVIDNTIGVIVNTYENVSAAYTLIKNDILTQIESTQEEISENANGIMSQVNELINVGCCTATNTVEKVEGFFNACSELLMSIQNLSGDETESENTAVIYQSTATMTTASTAQAALTTEYETRDMAGSALNKVNDSADLLTEGYDLLITKLGNNFNPNHNVWSSTLNIIAQTNSILIDRSFDLKAKQSFILTSPNDPITLTWKYYKDMDQLEFFIRTNKLADTENIEMQAGREVVVYV